MVLSDGESNFKETTLLEDRRGDLENQKYLVTQVFLWNTRPPGKRSYVCAYEEEEDLEEEQGSPEDDNEEEEEEEEENDPEKEKMREMGLPVQFNYKGISSKSKKRRHKIKRKKHHSHSERERSIDEVDEAFKEYWAKHGQALVLKNWWSLYKNYISIPPSAEIGPTEQNNGPASEDAAISSSTPSLASSQHSSEMRSVSMAAPQDGLGQEPPLQNGGEIASESGENVTIPYHQEMEADILIEDKSEISLIAGKLKDSTLSKLEDGSQDEALLAADKVTKMEDEAASPVDNAAMVEEGVLSTVVDNTKMEEDLASTTDDGTKMEERVISSVDDATKIEDEAASPADDATKMEDGAASPADDATKMEDGTASPADDATKMEDGAVSPADDATKMEDGAASPADEATKMEDETASPADDATKMEEDHYAKEWEKLWDQHYLEVYEYQYNLFYSARASCQIENYEEYMDENQEEYPYYGEEEYDCENDGEWEEDFDGAINSDDQIGYDANEEFTQEMSTNCAIATQDVATDSGQGTPPEDVDMERSEDSDGPPKEIPIRGIPGKLVRVHGDVFRDAREVMLEASSQQPSATEPVPGPQQWSIDDEPMSEKLSVVQAPEQNSLMDPVKEKLSVVQAPDKNSQTDPVRKELSDVQAPEQNSQTDPLKENLTGDQTLRKENESALSSLEVVHKLREAIRGSVHQSLVAAGSEVMLASPGGDRQDATPDSGQGSSLQGNDVDRAGMDSDDSNGPPDEIPIHGIPGKLIHIRNGVFMPGPQGDEEGIDGSLESLDPEHQSEASTQQTPSRLKYLPEDIKDKAHIVKYYKKRFSLFSRYNEGIKLDEESWFSVTPERIARHIAERVAATADLVVDGFCGAGGNAIQFALHCKHVIAIDIDPKKLEMARHNANIYGVGANIEFICGDFLQVGPQLQAGTVFLSPPWGGPDYKKKSRFPLDHITPPIEKIMEVARQISPNVVFFAPKNMDHQDILSFARPEERVELQITCIDKAVKAITAYYGDFPYEISNAIAS